MGFRLPLAEFGSKPGVVIPVEAEFGRHIYHLFMIRSKFRDELSAFLKSNGIGTEVYYPVPLHLQACFSNMGFREGDFPYGEQAALQTLALPIYPELTDGMLSRIVDTISEFLNLPAYR